MQIFELLLIAVGLSMDAFAVAMCRGIKMVKFDIKKASIIALFFGVFQAGMPILGWLIGKQFVAYISAFDHWIAFSLLFVIGAKMIYGAIKPDEAKECGEDSLNIKQLLVLSVATSIDALAVGITLAFLSFNIAIAVSIIGIITFVLSLLGVFLGNKVGIKYKTKAEIIGGIVLILIGVKILLEHLGVIK